MVLDQIRRKLVIQKINILHNELIPHEKVSLRGKNKLKNYLNNFHSEIILPSILVCNKSNVIIDGHHRVHALKLLEFDKIPVSMIDYNSDLILTNEKIVYLKKKLLALLKTIKSFLQEHQST